MTKPPWERGPEGLAVKREPGPEGLGVSPKDDESAVGAALNLGPWRWKER
jgi:hypothetical protein